MIIVQLDSEQLNSLIQNAVRKVISETPKAIQPTDTDHWLDLTELCNYHPDKPSKPTVYGWVNAGTIPVHKGCKKLRFLKSEIDDFLRQGRKRTRAEIESNAHTYLAKKNGGQAL
ncbi:MAG: helix-turn-helix domain-containing protein [Bacteroidetes bacterium]|nr:helix-turn-helix domain-containing protein [Bacteroidota bacterium]